MLACRSHCRASSDGEEYVMTLKDEPEDKKTIEYGVDRRTILLGGPMLVAASSSLGAVASAQPLAADPLPSWNDGATKKSITDFVARVTTQGGADFVPPDQRIATFDNDGTLWIEQPIYCSSSSRSIASRRSRPSTPSGRTRNPSPRFSRAMSRQRSRAASTRSSRSSWRPTPA